MEILGAPLQNTEKDEKLSKFRGKNANFRWQKNLPGFFSPGQLRPSEMGNTRFERGRAPLSFVVTPKSAIRLDVGEKAHFS